MIVNIKKLTTDLRKAKEKTTGGNKTFNYLYSVYRRFCEQEIQCITDIDLTKFDIEDLEDFEIYYDNVIEHNQNKVNVMMNKIEKFKACPKKVNFV